MRAVGIGHTARYGPVGEPAGSVRFEGRVDLHRLAAPDDHVLDDDGRMAGRLDMQSIGPGQEELMVIAVYGIGEYGPVDFEDVHHGGEGVARARVGDYPHHSLAGLFSEVEHPQPVFFAVILDLTRRRGLRIRHLDGPADGAEASVEGVFRAAVDFIHAVVALAVGVAARRRVPGREIPVKRVIHGGVGVVAPRKRDILGARMERYGRALPVRVVVRPCGLDFGLRIGAAAASPSFPLVAIIAVHVDPGCVVAAAGRDPVRVQHRQHENLAVVHEVRDIRVGAVVLEKVVNEEDGDLHGDPFVPVGGAVEIDLGFGFVGFDIIAYLHQEDFAALDALAEGVEPGDVRVVRGELDHLGEEIRILVVCSLSPGTEHLHDPGRGIFDQDLRFDLYPPFRQELLKDFHLPCAQADIKFIFETPLDRYTGPGRLVHHIRGKPPEPDHGLPARRNVGARTERRGEGTRVIRERCRPRRPGQKPATHYR